MLSNTRDLIEGRMLSKDKDSKKKKHHGFHLSSISKHLPSKQQLKKFEKKAAHTAGSAAHLAEKVGKAGVELNKETGVFTQIADKSVSAALSKSGHGD